MQSEEEKRRIRCQNGRSKASKRKWRRRMKRRNKRRRKKRRKRRRSKFKRRGRISRMDGDGMWKM